MLNTYYSYRKIRTTIYLHEKKTVIPVAPLPLTKNLTASRRLIFLLLSSAHLKFSKTSQPAMCNFQCRAQWTSRHFLPGRRSEKAWELKCLCAAPQQLESHRHPKPPPHSLLRRMKRALQDNQVHTHKQGCSIVQGSSSSSSSSISEPPISI
jgi:hypothetical protein